MIIKSSILFMLFLVFLPFSKDAIASNNNYLLKPTGKYQVGFRDYHWINTTKCPDTNYKGNNKNDFSSKNIQFCREIMVRIYYPSTTRKESSNLYYNPLVKSIKNDLIQVPEVKKEHLLQLNHIKSHSIEKLPPVSGKKFPIIFFSPGYGSQVEMYENFILELVSHGYVVIGINSLFINGDIALPNNHVVKFNVKLSLNDLIKTQSDDFDYIYRKIISIHNLDLLFSTMDIQRIGALGQSLGGEIVANAAHSHPSWFKAAATLDSGIDKNDDTWKEFDMPFMRLISAHRRCEKPIIPDAFKLGDDDFLVGISPSVKNTSFSYHMNFTDYSTLQYIPAEQAALAYYSRNKMRRLFGTGNGWEITHSINIYLLSFFNTYLKQENDNPFKSCLPLIKNSYIECGKINK